MHIDMTNPKDVELLDRLRELRLYHWTEAMRYRGQQQGLVDIIEASPGRNSSLKDCVKNYYRMASMHLGHVQTLNDFFAIGDTAERDASE